MFIDASALTAIMLQESDARTFANTVSRAERPLTSSLAIWETVTAVSREFGELPSIAHATVIDMRRSLRIELVAVPPEAAALAVEAFERFGKGRHPAALNFGDCFAYACARHFRVPLLYKGEDFAQTDIEAVHIDD